MKLKDYLQETETSVREFARQVRVNHAQVIRWQKGQKPTLANLRRIHMVTLGVVSINDF